MKRFACVLVLCLVACAAVFAAPSNLTKKKISTSALLNLLPANVKEESEVDEDGDLYIQLGDLWAYVYLSDDNTMLLFSTGIEPEKAPSESRGAQLTNSWNADRPFATLFYKDGLFRLSYLMPCDGGIHADNFTAAVSYFLATYDALWDYLIDEGVL